MNWLLVSLNNGVFLRTGGLLVVRAIDSDSSI